jgi:AraC-like DNA-binding protein
MLEAPVQQNQLRTASFAPSPILRPYVRRFVVVEYTAGEATKLLPGAGIVAAFRFKGTCLMNGFSAPNALVTGVWDTARLLTHSGSCANVIAMFTPTGAAAFLREPVANLFNATMPFEQQVRRSQLDVIEEQLAESSDDLARIETLENFLLAELRRHDPDPLAAAAVADIQRTRGSLRIASLAMRLGFSQSSLERRFHRAIGTTPKKFSAIVRLRHVVRLRQAGASLTEISHAAGYTDQAHFIKDFRRFAGEAPESFFRQTSGFC